MTRPGRRSTQRSTHILIDSFGYTPFDRQRALEAGLTLGQLRAVIDRGLVRRVSRNVLVVQPDASAHQSPDSMRAVLAAIARIDGLRLAVTGRASADLHGLPVIRPPGHADDHQGVEVLVHQDDVARCGRRLDGAIVRPVPLLPDDITIIDGIPVTSILHTAIDVVRMGTRSSQRHRARALPLPEALVPLDAATFAIGAVNSEEASAMIRALRPRFRYGPGIRSVDVAAHVVDPRSESPLESWSRGYVIDAGLPMPLTQFPVIGADGREYRVDFCWPDARVILEVDGLTKYGDTPDEVRVNKRREFERQRALEAAGWTVIRWTWDDLARDPWSLVRSLRALLRSAA